MASKYKIEYLPIAEKDLVEIIEYIQTDSPTSALRVINELDEAIQKLEDFLYLGHVPKDTLLKYKNYRVLVVNNYLVFYVVIEQVIEIRRIIHGRRQYDFLL